MCLYADDLIFVFNNNDNFKLNVLFFMA